MTRVLTMAYGVCAYVLFLVTFLWAIAFVMNMPVATTIDGGGVARHRRSVRSL